MPVCLELWLIFVKVTPSAQKYPPCSGDWDGAPRGFRVGSFLPESIDVAAGLVFVYLFMSILATIGREAFEGFLRRRAREQTLESPEDPDMVAETTSPIEDREIVAASLRTFMRLPVSQRSSVILADVLGHSLQETAEIVDGNVLTIKGALQRGRERLRGLAKEDDTAPVPELDELDRKRLKTYVDLFNAHDFDAIKAMLAEDVQFEVVNRLRRTGKSAVPYFANYAARPQWRFLAGLVDRRPAVLVYDGEDPDERVKYFVLLEWGGNKVTSIRDFVFARYAMDGADIRVMD